eukprot:1158938-Pelagomonas_calceolata.AAC.9
MRNDYDLCAVPSWSARGIPRKSRYKITGILKPEVWEFDKKLLQADALAPVGQFKYEVATIMRALAMDEFLPAVLAAAATKGARGAESVYHAQGCGQHEVARRQRWDGGVWTCELPVGALQDMQARASFDSMGRKFKRSRIAPFLSGLEH